MKRIIAGLFATVALLGSVVVAQAATLTLDAGTLQTLRVTKSPEIDLVDVYLEVRDYNNGHGRLNRDPSTATYEVLAGGQYYLLWGDVGGTLRDCSGEGSNIDHSPFDGTDVSTLGPSPQSFTAEEEGNHRYFLCVQGGEGSIDPSQFRLSASDGVIVGGDG